MNTYKSEVIICGAGTSGLPAALSATRLGLNVIIIEEDWSIGGAAIDYCIQIFCGEPLQGTHLELKNKLKEHSSEKSAICFRTASFLTAWQELLKGLPVSIFIGQKINNVITSENDGHIIAVESNYARFEGEIFIDATGDATIAINTSCEVRMGRESADEYGEKFAPKKADGFVQMCTLMYSLKRIEGSTSKGEPNWAKFNDNEYIYIGDQQWFVKIPQTLMIIEKLLKLRMHP
jgi:hypothetical protein